jgi:hypothetical protein
MGSFADYLELKVLDHVTGKAAYTMPTIYVGLSTADPLDTAAGLAEPSGNNYSRVTTSAATWQVAASGATQNILAITFPTASGSWGTITHFAGFDAASGTNMLWHGQLSAPKAVGSGDTPSFAVGDLDITLD